MVEKTSVAGADFEAGLPTSPGKSIFQKKIFLFFFLKNRNDDVVECTIIHQTCLIKMGFK